MKPTVTNESEEARACSGNGGGCIVFDWNGASVYPSLDGELGRLAAGSNRGGLKSIKIGEEWCLLPLLVNLLRLSHRVADAEQSALKWTETVEEAKIQLAAVNKAKRRWNRFAWWVIPANCEIASHSLNPMASPGEFLDWWGRFSTDATIKHGPDFLDSVASLYRSFDAFEKDRDDQLVIAAIKIAAQQAGGPPTKSAVKDILKSAGFHAAGWERIRWNEVWKRFGFQWLPTGRSGRKS